MPTLLIGAATNGLAGIDVDLERMAGVVPTYGLGPVIVVRDATLAEIRARLAELVARTEAGAPVLLYLTGHGGYVVNRGYDAGAERPAPSRLHFFRALPGRGGADEALFEVEVALWCARLAARTNNVAVVVDSCHAGGLVRDDADQAFVAAFERWCDEHQDEIDGLEVEAHADVVRLAAAGRNGVARAASTGSALTAGLLAALAEPGAARRSWFGLFARIEAHMAMAGAVQEPRLAGPVSRRVFAVDEGQRADGQGEAAATVRRFLKVGGVAIGALGLRVAWGRVRGGVCERLTEPAEVGAEDPLYVRIANVGDERRFVGVFWVGEDDEVVLLSRAESMGVELDGRTTYVLGDRPFTRAPRGVVPPRRPLADGERRVERLVIVAAATRQVLWSAADGGEGRRSAEIFGVEVVHIGVCKREQVYSS